MTSNKPKTTIQTSLTIRTTIFVFSLLCFIHSNATKDTSPANTIANNRTSVLTKFVGTGRLQDGLIDNSSSKRGSNSRNRRTTNATTTTNNNSVFPTSKTIMLATTQANKNAITANFPNDNKEDHQLCKQTTTTAVATTEKTQAKAATHSKENNATNNTKLKDACPHKDLNARAVILLCVLVCIIVIGFTGNLLILIVLFRSKKLLRHPTNLFIASLNCCNIGVLVTCVPFKIHTALHGNSFCFSDNSDDVTCAFYNVIDLVFHVCSVTHLFVISVERLMAIKSPFYHRHRMTRRFTLNVLSLVWLYSLFWVALSFVPWHPESVEGYDNRVHFVTLETGENQRFCVIRNTNYVIALCVIGFILPIVVMTIMYGVTLQNIIRSTGKLDNKNSLMADISLTMSHGRKKEAALTKTVAVIYVSFLVCWMPSIVLTIYKNSSSAAIITETVRIIFFVVMPTIPTCAFPVIYVKHYGKFGEELKNMRSSRQKRILQMQISF